MATCWARPRWVAHHTDPIPPTPTIDSSRYFPATTAPGNASGDVDPDGGTDVLIRVTPDAAAKLRGVSIGAPGYPVVAWGYVKPQSDVTQARPSGDRPSSMPPPPPTAGQRPRLLPLVLALSLGMGGGLALVGYFFGRGDFGLGGQGAQAHTTVRATPGVVAAIRDMSRLDTTSFHIEKVIEARDQQSRLWGLLQPKDAILLVAVGDVVAGVDLSKLREEDVRIDPGTHAVRIVLPAPEVLSSSLDERATHVVVRVTDVLAERNEQLEGEARRQAEQEMREAAVAAGILERSRASADRTLRALLRSLGYDDVAIVFSDRTIRETSGTSAL
jgi:Protein of unknown function (DUF4230)